MFYDNPVLIKELNGRVRGKTAFILISVYAVIISVVAISVMAASSLGKTVRHDELSKIGRYIFIALTTTQGILLSFISPALTATSLTTEKEKQTYESLMLSLLSPHQIVWGKLLSALSFAGLIILTSIPIVSLSLLFGGVSIDELIGSFLSLAMVIVLSCQLGLLNSSIFSRTYLAIIFTYGFLFFFPFTMISGIPAVFMGFSGNIPSAKFLGFDSPLWLMFPVIFFSTAYIIFYTTINRISLEDKPIIPRKQFAIAYFIIHFFFLFFVLGNYYVEQLTVLGILLGTLSILAPLFTCYSGYVNPSDVENKNRHSNFPVFSRLFSGSSKTGILYLYFLAIITILDIALAFQINTAIGNRFNISDADVWITAMVYLFFRILPMAMLGLTLSVIFDKVSTIVIASYIVMTIVTFGEGFFALIFAEANMFDKNPFIGLIIYNILFLILLFFVYRVKRKKL